MEEFWGTVCDSGFGREEAIVVCRQLDKSLGIHQVYMELLHEVNSNYS